MSLYPLTPKPGRERYTVLVGWSPHRTLFATVADFDFNPDIDPSNPPDFLDLGMMEQVLDPAFVVAAVEPYAVIPADPIDQLHTDMLLKPVRRRLPRGR